jgi:hypothetical protein
VQIGKAFQRHVFGALLAYGYGKPVQHTLKKEANLVESCCREFAWYPIGALELVHLFICNLGSLIAKGAKESCRLVRGLLLVIDCHIALHHLRFVNVL